ncbi:hypothetical protein WAE58_22470 [Pedobacter panaciterrae]|uniref:YD repeat-containing protein n=1 Tax=Pedobacter panaciterrae TaxID=363849 RepID=A0ABU8NTH4_9SPHI
MKKQLTLLIVAVSLLLVTCKKKSGPDEPEQTPVKLLSRIIEVSGFPTPTTKFTIYTYDEKKRISTISWAGKEFATYTYHGDELFSIDTKFGNKRNLSEFSYADGKPKQIVRKFYTDGELKGGVTLGNIYTGDKITEVHVNESGTVAQKRFYRYAGDNIVGYDSQTDVFIIKESTFGTKKSMYFNSRLKYINGIETFDRFSPNDLLASVIKYPNGAELRQKNTFTYDDDDFPVTLLTEATFESGESAGTFRYTFEYKMY